MDIIKQNPQTQSNINKVRYSKSIGYINGWKDGQIKAESNFDHENKSGFQNIFFPNNCFEF